MSSSPSDDERTRAMLTLLADVWGPGDAPVLSTARLLARYWQTVDALRGAALLAVAGALARTLGPDLDKEQGT